MNEKDLFEQNKMIIALLARSTLGVEYIEKVVRAGKKKGNPDDFVRAYNALDGTKSVTEIAKLVGVSQPSMTVVLQTWEAKGIVYKTGTAKQSPYVRLLKLPVKSEKLSASAKPRSKRKLKSIQRKASITETTPESAMAELEPAATMPVEVKENEEKSNS